MQFLVGINILNVETVAKEKTLTVESLQLLPTIQRQSHNCEIIASFYLTNRLPHPLHILELNFCRESPCVAHVGFACNPFSVGNVIPTQESSLPYRLPYSYLIILIFTVLYVTNTYFTSLSSVPLNRFNSPFFN